MTRANDSSRLTWELQADFLDEPFEDGMDHPAEQTLKQWLTPEREDELIPTLEEICRDEQHPVFAAGTLKCLARLERRPGTPEQRAGMVRSALQAENVELRDAGAEAAEQWDGEPQVLEVLKGHQDPTDWIQEYINGIIDKWGT